MKWVKQGRIFNPDKVLPQGMSASLMPISKVIDDDKGVIRVYFSPRDLKNRSEVHFFDFNQDLYGKHLTVALLYFLRDEHKFDGVPSLVQQLKKDEDSARNYIKTLD